MRSQVPFKVVEVVTEKEVQERSVGVKTMKSMLCFRAFFIFLYMVLSVTLACGVQSQRVAGYQPRPKPAHQVSLTAEQKSQVATNVLIHYFEQMTRKNVLGADGLRRLIDAPDSNPIAPEAYHTSDLVDTFKNQLDILLEKGKEWFDRARIKAWAQDKIQELEEYEHTRQHVHEETREVHIPMRFVEIPAGKYEDAIAHEKFEIAPGVEIQETPVTQFQWATVMVGENPSHRVSGIDAEVHVLYGNQVAICPDAPVENVSYKDVQGFLRQLNRYDESYRYALPSVREYQALVQSLPEGQWFGLIQRARYKTDCDDTRKDCPVVVSGDYLLSHNTRRVFGLVGHVWQWTRDMVDFTARGGENVGAHLVYGGSCTTHAQKLPMLRLFLRNIYYDRASGDHVGLRLVRYARPAALEPLALTYHRDVLRWAEEDADCDQDWHWNKELGNLLFKDDELALMLEHRSDYSREAQHTIKVLAQEVLPGHDPVSYLKERRVLFIGNRKIEDVSPLVHLVNLNELYLAGNFIQDVSPLAKLTNLTWLRLDDNHITRLSPLTHLTNLIMLDLGKNQIQDISPLASLTKLKWLFLGNNQVETVLALANLTGLEKLDLRSNQVSDFSPLAPLNNLKLNLDQKHAEQLGTHAKSFLSHVHIVTESWV